MSHRKFDFRTAYIDLLINLLTGTVVLFILTTLLIAPITKNKDGIKKNADYVVTMEWPQEIDCDVDLWVRDPENNIISYKIKEAGLMYYERDDMGHRLSVFNIGGKDVLVDPDNKEYITFRGTIPGEYIVNVHSYSCADPKSEPDLPKGLSRGTAINLPVIVEITKINPDFMVVKHVEVKMNKIWQEKTAFRFIMNDDKNIIRFMYDQVPIGAVEGKQ